MLFVIPTQPASAQEIAQYHNQTIAKVEVSFKNIKINTSNSEELLDLINIRPGEPYSAIRVREAILKLYRSGRAANVEVAATKVANGINLNFIVTRQLRVDKITFSGVSMFPESELQPRVVGLDPGAKVSQPSIDRSAENLVKFYQDAGYFQVAITASITAETDSPRAAIDFAIMPGVQAMVGNIEINGDLKLERERALKDLQTTPGSPYTLAQLQSDLELLRKRHIEENYLDPRINAPTISYNNESNMVSIRLNINSGPQVSVMVEGFDIGKDRLRRTLPLLQQGGADDFSIEEGRRRIFELIQQEGYFFAEIEALIERQPEEIRITYQVERGQRYRVGELRLIGSDEITINDVIDSLLSRRAAFSSRGLTSRESLTRDSETIAAKLRNLGYPKATVVERRLGISINNQDLLITFVVEPGPRMMMSEVDFNGNSLFPPDILREQLPIRKIPYLSPTRINEDTEKLLSLYSKRGYAEAQITANIEQIDDEHARVIYNIIEGDPVQINRIIISNRGKSNAPVIRKYLTFQEGDLLKRDDLSKSEQQLYATGAFRTVNIHSEFINRNSDGHALHDVFIETIESQPYTLIYGFGYQSEDGARGLFQISNVNLLGRLQTGTLTLRASRREQLGQISYLFPRPFDLPVNPLLIFFYRRRRELNFNSRRFTAQLQLERRLNETSGLIFRYTFEDVKVFDLQIAGRDLDRIDKPIKLGRVSTTFLSDNRDNIFDATKGTLTTADFSFATSGLGSDREFLRVFINHQRYLRVLEKPQVIFASNMQIGLARTFDDRLRLPITERFFGGGANTLRGFGFEKAGPRNANGQPVGGNALIVLNSELRFPIVSRFGGVLFHDTGNVFRSVSDFSMRKFSNTIGTGLRVATPIGPVRFDVGFLLNPNVPERRVQFHFSFGQAF